MKKMSSVMKKGMSCFLAAALVCGSTGVLTYAKSRQNEEAPEAYAKAQVQENSLNKVTEENTAELNEKDKEELAKEETVYVIANADGSTQKLIVSDWLKNALGSDKLTDTTELTDISNVKGEESFAKADGNVAVWDAAGNDIYYQGSIEKELPVDLKITYKLNGKEISPEELAGQSGKVTIRFDYTNRQKEKVQVGGRQQELYVPFVVITGFVVDNDNFSNMEISGGKIINDGERSIVMGYAMPGLKDNLDIGSEDFDVDEIDIPDYVEITADTTDFELAATMTVATNEVFGDLDVDAQDKMDDISADMDELADAMDELMDGTSELYDGVLELYDGTEELTDGIDELNNGARELRDGASALYDGTKTLYDGAGALKSGAGQLFAGVKKLADGLALLTEKNDTLNGGAQQVYQGLLQLANAELAQMQAQGAGVSILSTEGKTPEEFIASIEQNIAVLTATENALKSQLGVGASQDTAAKTDVQEDASEPTEDENVKQETEQPADTSEDQKTEAQPETEVQEENSTQITQPEEEILEEEQTAEEQPAAEDIAAVKAEVQAHEAVNVKAAPTDDMSAAILSKIQSIEMTISTLKLLEGAYQVSLGVTGYTAGVDQIYAGVQELMKNAPAFTSGVDSLVSGAGKLKDGAGELRNGTIELKDGTSELRDGGQELKDGVVELRDGSEELRDGVIEFNDEGIQKLIDTFDGDLQDLVDRFEGTKDAAKAYKSFAGISDGMQGSVKFIYKTAAIEK